YVGITRARERLYVTHAWHRTLHGGMQYNPPSRFLDEIPSALIEESSASRKARSSRSDGGRRWGNRSGDDDFGRRDGPGSGAPRPTAPTPTRAHEKNFEVGDDVRHNVWGEGVVLMV